MSHTAPTRVLAMAGSSRSGALSLGLRDAAAAALRMAGAAVELLDLHALDLPLYDGDLESCSGVPEGARRLRDALMRSEGLLFVTPEYNGFPTPPALNAWDWLSRLAAEGDKPSAWPSPRGSRWRCCPGSPGPMGGVRAAGPDAPVPRRHLPDAGAPQQLALVAQTRPSTTTGR